MANSHLVHTPAANDHTTACARWLCSEVRTTTDKGKVTCRKCLSTMEGRANG